MARPKTKDSTMKGIGEIEFPFNYTARRRHSLHAEPQEL